MHAPENISADAALGCYFRIGLDLMKRFLAFAGVGQHKGLGEGNLEQRLAAEFAASNDRKNEPRSRCLAALKVTGWIAKERGSGSNSGQATEQRQACKINTVRQLEFHSAPAHTSARDEAASGRLAALSPATFPLPLSAANLRGNFCPLLRNRLRTPRAALSGNSARFAASSGRIASVKGKSYAGAALRPKALDCLAHDSAAEF